MTWSPKWGVEVSFLSHKAWGQQTIGRYPSASRLRQTQEMDTATPRCLLRMVQKCLPKQEPNQRVQEHTSRQWPQPEPPKQAWPKDTPYF